MTQRHTPPAQPSRREFLVAASTTLAALAAGAVLPSASAIPLSLASAEPFSYAVLRERARSLAAAPYQPPPHPPREVLEQIDYDAHGRLRFKTEDALFANGPGRFPVTFFAMGRFFQTPVRMHVIDARGATREIRYAPDYFAMPPDSPAHHLGRHAGFAGFRIQESRLGDQQHLDWRSNDWAAFLGASYFRAIGGLYQYGLSARGIAVNVAVNGQAEEFPAFTDFYFATPEDDSAAVIVYALLDGPSLSGAYRFRLERSEAVIMDVEATLFLRRDIERLGLAPATSMYWYSETMHQRQTDWRPEIHDSDGLALWTGNGERIWRPLNNPAQVTVSAFQDKSPRGFGLLQRDRYFEHYLDGVHYERRPDLWVEPLGDWGEGSVQLVELPTDDETHDNIVAMWVPAGKVNAGLELHLRYRLHWTADEPFPAPLARCIATRTGQGGEPGQQRSASSTKFVVEFLGGGLSTLPAGVIPQAVVTATHGTLGPASVEPVPDGITGHWRVRFDLTPASLETVELRLYLRLADSALSETWLYQFHPSRPNSN